MGCLDVSRIRGRGNHRGGLKAAGGAAAPTPGPASPGAQGSLPFFYQNSGPCHTQKGALRGGDRDRAKGSRNVKSQIGLPGGAQAETTAEPRADVDGADGEGLPEQFK